MLSTMDVVRRLMKIKHDVEVIAASAGSADAKAEVEALAQKVEECIDNMQSDGSDVHYRKKHAVLIRLFMPYMIAASMAMDKLDMDKLETDVFDKGFVKKVLEKYIEEQGE
jgi:hypothetical protein